MREPLEGSEGGLRVTAGRCPLPSHNLRLPSQAPYQNLGGRLRLPLVPTPGGLRVPSTPSWGSGGYTPSYPLWRGGLRVTSTLYPLSWGSGGYPLPSGGYPLEGVWRVPHLPILGGLEGTLLRGSGGYPLLPSLKGGSEGTPGLRGSEGTPHPPYPLLGGSEGV